MRLVVQELLLLKVPVAEKPMPGYRTWNAMVACMFVRVARRPKGLRSLDGTALQLLNAI